MKEYSEADPLNENTSQASTSDSNIGTNIGIVIAVFAVVGLVAFFVVRRHRRKVANYLQRGEYNVHDGGNDDDDEAGVNASDNNDDEGSAV